MAKMIKADSKKETKNAVNLTEAAKSALTSCYSSNSGKGFEVDYVGADVDLNNFICDIEVKKFDEMETICKNITQWECAFEAMGAEKESEVLGGLTDNAKCIRVKLEDIHIADFNPLNPPDAKKYSDYLENCEIDGAGVVIPLSSSTDDPCEID